MLACLLVYLLTYLGRLSDEKHRPSATLRQSARHWPAFFVSFQGRPLLCILASEFLLHVFLGLSLFILSHGSQIGACLVMLLAGFMSYVFFSLFLFCCRFQIGACLVMLIIIIIIAFKGAIRDFLQSPHSAANCLQHARSSGPSATVWKSRATHRALITCKCHVTCHLARRDSSAINFDRVEIAFIWALFYWLNH